VEPSPLYVHFVSLRIISYQKQSFAKYWSLHISSLGEFVIPSMPFVIHCTHQHQGGKWHHQSAACFVAAFGSFPCVATAKKEILDVQKTADICFTSGGSMNMFKFV